MFKSHLFLKLAFCISAAFIAQSAQAESSQTEQFRTALTTSRALVAAKDISTMPAFEEPLVDMETSIHRWRDDKAQIAYELTLTQPVPGTNTWAEKDVQPLWQCIARSTQKNRDPAIKALMANQRDLKRDEGPNDTLGSSRWMYHDCSSINHPVRIRLEYYKRGNWELAVEDPALDPLACNGQTELGKLLWACLDYVNGTPKTVTAMGTFTPSAPKTKEALISTDFGTATVRLIAGAKPQCWVIGGTQSDTNWTPTLSYDTSHDRTQDWLVSTYSLYDGYFYQGISNGTGLFLCDPDHIGTRIALMAIPMQDGTNALQFVADAITETSWIAPCENPDLR